MSLRLNSKKVLAAECNVVTHKTKYMVSAYSVNVFPLSFIEINYTFDFSKGLYVPEFI